MLLLLLLFQMKKEQYKRHPRDSTFSCLAMCQLRTRLCRYNLKSEKLFELDSIIRTYVALNYQSASLKIQESRMRSNNRWDQQMFFTIKDPNLLSNARSQRLHEITYCLERQPIIKSKLQVKYMSVKIYYRF